MAKPHKVTRRPLRNFFIKKSLQYKIILPIVAAVLLITVLTIGIVTYIYSQKAKTGNFYFMSNDIRQDLELKNILSIVLPTVLTGQIVSIILAVAIGFFTSRKVAVPIYKLEQWATQIKAGKLKTQLAFRETQAMSDLTNQCNALAENYRQLFKCVDNSLTQIENELPYTSESIHFHLRAIRSLLNAIDYKEEKGVHVNAPPFHNKVPNDHQSFS